MVSFQVVKQKKVTLQGSIPKYFPEIQRFRLGITQTFTCLPAQVWGTCFSSGFLTN